MDGMVAVVRGLRDAGLAVTLLDNGKQFTLAPNGYKQQPVADERGATSSNMPLVMQPGSNGMHGISPHMTQIPHMPNVHMPYTQGVQPHTQPVLQSPQPSHLRTTGSDAMPDRSVNNSGTQAIDGRYASVYKTTVCKMKPTNPPVQLTEFPPQRPGRESLPGQDNFIVGGTGSGDTTYSPTRIPNNYRGGMCWTDRTCVCSPRPSRQPDAFASSLRKYPYRLSPDRSSEIVERLITYTQAKNYGKAPPRYQSANCQTRSFEVCEPVEERKSKSPSKLVCRGVDSPKPRFCEEFSPREKPRRVDLDPQEYRKPSSYARNYDVRYLRDVTRMVRDNMKTVSNSYHQPVSPAIRDRHETPSTRPSMQEDSIPSMVHSEIQAAAKMICREVSTTPRIEPSKRSVAVALTPISTQPSEGGVFLPTHKSVQVFGHARKSVQTTLSCIEISSETFTSHTRKSKSEEDVNNNKNLQCQILKKLEEIFLQQQLKFLKHKQEDMTKHAECNEDSNGARNIEDVPHTSEEHYPEYDENGLAHRRQISKDLVNMKQIGHKNFKVYCAEITNFMICNNHIRRVICDWLNEIPLQTRDFLGRLVNKDEILSYIVCRLKIIPQGALYNKKKFRTEILDIVDDIPVSMANCNRDIYLNKLAEDLISRLEHAKIRDFYKENIPKFKYPKSEFIVNTATTSHHFKRFIRPSEDEIRLFVKNELIEAIQNSQLDIDSSKVGDIESDLVDVLLDTLENISSGKDEDVTNEITTILRQTGQLLKNQAEIFSTKLIKKLKKRFFHSLSNQCIEDYLRIHGQSKSDSEAEIKESDLTPYNNLGSNKVTNETCRKGNCDTPTPSQVTHSHNEGDAKSNIDTYKRQLSKEIDQWLSSIANEVPKVHDRSFRYSVVRDLAEDVVDRRKYLQLNPTCLLTEKDELEHFKYQIFKWINKVVGENNMATLEKAPELMQKIRSIPVPVLTKRSRRSTRIHNSSGSSSQRSSSATQNQPTSTCTKCTMSNLETPPDKSQENITSAPAKQDQGAEVSPSDIFFDILRHSRPNTPVLKKIKPIPHTREKMITIQQTTGVPSNVGTATGPPNQQPPMNHLTPAPPSIKQLSDEYDEFLKSWVQSVPMPPDTDPELVEKMKLGLYHGIWQVIAKLKSSPTTMVNNFYYEDVLDDEIEELFSLVPPSGELQTKKHILKVQLIEKTSHMNEMIKVAHAPDTFAQKLVESVEVYVPRVETYTGGEDPVKLFEDLKILYLADEYILYTRYKDEDPIKATVFRSRLLRRIQEFISDIKQLHNKELKDIDEGMYMNEILTAMQQVPLPNNETVKQEADEVMLGMEIDKWLSDLPIAANDDALEQLKRRRLRDMLAKKIYELEKQSSFADITDERALRHEVSQILEKLPLGRDESLKINFMVDELTNRIKNREKGADRQRRSTVMFNESIAYNDFSKNMTGSSSPQKEQQQQSQQLAQQPQNQNQTLNQSLNQSKWVGPPSAAIHPAPTSAMQDAAGRTWYSFDQRRPSVDADDKGPSSAPPPLSQQAAQALVQKPPDAPAVQPQADATNQSFWLSKYLEKVESKRKEGYEERGVMTQGLGEAPWPFMATQPDVCGRQGQLGQGSMTQGPMGQSMSQGPLGQSMGGLGPVGQSTGQGPMEQSMGGQGPMGQSMGQGPMGQPGRAWQSMGGPGPMGQSMGGQGQMGQPGRAWQSMGAPGPMGQSMGGQGPMGQPGRAGGAWQSMGGPAQMGQSMGGQGPMGQSMGRPSGARQSLGGPGQMGQSMGGKGPARQSVGGQGTMRQSVGGQVGQPSGVQGSNVGPDAMYQSMDATRAPAAMWLDQPGAQASQRQSISRQGAMPGTAAPSNVPRQSIIQSGGPRQSVGVGRKSVQLIDDKGSSAVKSPGRQSLSKRDKTSDNTQYASMDATQAPPGMWGAQPGQQQPLQQRPVAQLPQRFPGQYISGQSGPSGQASQPGQPANVNVSGQPQPNQESMWLNKYLSAYEAAHPPTATPQASLQQSGQFPQNSLQFGPQQQNASVLEPPEYGMFNQERPLSSSYQQSMNRSVGAPLGPAGQVSGIQTIQDPLNASARPASTSQHCSNKSCQDMSSGVPPPMATFQPTPLNIQPLPVVPTLEGSALGVSANPLPFVGGPSPAGANTFGGVRQVPEMGPAMAGTFPGAAGGVPYVDGLPEQDIEGGVYPAGASIQQGVGSGIAMVADAGQQAPGFYRSTDQEGIQMFTDQNRSMPAGYYTPQQQRMPSSIPGRPTKSRGTRTMCVRRQLDYSDGDDEYESVGSRCRCFEKMKKYKAKSCFPSDCVPPRPMRYCPPFIPCHPYPYY